MTVVIREGRDFDAAEILRRSPVAKVPGAGEVLDYCLRRSITYQGRLGDEIACVWGLIPPTLLSDTAYLWLLTTDIIAEHKFLFIRYSQLFIEHMLTKYPVIVGDCFVENASAIRWLKWLGAEFGPEIQGRRNFTIRAKNG